NPLNVGSLGGGSQEAKYRGELDGVAVWTLDATYRDENGAVKRYIGDKAFYLIADMNGSLCHCGLQNLDVMGQPLDVYDYVVPEKDPSGIKLISESSPLAAP
ncbi:major capsid protein, partial [Psychrobacter celer]